MKLNDKRGARLFRAVKACELRLRNWSSPGEWLFAIYTRDDSYLGCVRLGDDDALRIDNPSKCARKERLVLEALCREHARIEP